MGKSSRVRQSESYKGPLAIEDTPDIAPATDARWDWQGQQQFDRPGAYNPNSYSTSYRPINGTPAFGGGKFSQTTYAPTSGYYPGSPGGYQPGSPGGFGSYRTGYDMMPPQQGPYAGHDMPPQYGPYAGFGRGGYQTPDVLAPQMENQTRLNMPYSSQPSPKGLPGVAPNNAPAPSYAAPQTPKNSLGPWPAYFDKMLGPKLGPLMMPTLYRGSGA